MDEKSALELKLTDLFYDYMSNDNVEEFNGKEVKDKTLTPVDLLWQETQNAIIENRERIKLFEDAMKEHKNDKGVVEVLKQQVQPLLEERVHFENSSMEYMKKLYEETEDLSYSRNSIRIPLYNQTFFSPEGHEWTREDYTNKYKVEIEYLFYDDLGVNKGKYEEYKVLEPSKRYDFIKANTEVTHIGLVFNGNIFIAVKGELNVETKGELGFEFFSLNTLS